ncbi:DUF29 family protein [Dolichospermum circinale CS-1225]|uniref:DUF29 family protein n=1 Tax=Dolichospermum circinale CS-537/01 TaxID=3021739 RepID=A0ABT5A717_9CYAN|nr:DUF29 family protein [Dolichospermum circinale]MDB9459036.1 DUF29 family protein [Dolichospermum circinale CS-545/17]MDB9465472.1 DUF29 family protein [Dolichospermum circinale CS-539/09]MDB9472419.1 DUF29 family protein [Dolichospermum circinale CS-539]MDB9487258.1 DUF29 family protein [Dolichospermum circinale CS-537/01]MDB9521636.1 DUF29 family protein [Dolichospermum circinale CS-1225]
MRITSLFWEQFYQIESLLEDSPSLGPYYLELFSDCYLKAVRATSTETKLSKQSWSRLDGFRRCLLSIYAT